MGKAGRKWGVEGATVQQGNLRHNLSRLSTGLKCCPLATTKKGSFSHALSGVRRLAAALPHVLYNTCRNLSSPLCMPRPRLCACQHNALLTPVPHPLAPHARRQVWNHTFFWESMKPGGGGSPAPGPLAEAIERDFGGVGKLRQELQTAGLTQFGSGWAWLVCDDEGEGKLLGR